MSPWQSSDLHINGLRLHYTRTGGQKPPLVLAHGFSDDGACWNPVAELFAQDYDIIMPDVRGHGLSEGPEHGYSIRQQVDDLYGIITALGLHKPLILGHSMGALVAMTLAGLYPDMPKAILLEDPPAWWYARGLPPHITPQQLTAMRDSFAQRRQQTRDALIAEQHRAAPVWSDAELEPWAESKRLLNPAVVEVFDPATPRALNWPDIYKNITCPTLLITADAARGAIVTSEGASLLHEIVPQLQVAHIPGAGHCIHRDQLQTYLEAIKPFLAAHT